MSAAVLDHADRAVFRARDNHRRRTDIRADEIAGIRNFGLERDVVPGGPMENALDLAPVDVLVGIDPVRNCRQVAGPNILLVEPQSVAARAGPGTIAVHAITVHAIAAHAGLRDADATRCSM